MHSRTFAFSPNPEFAAVFWIAFAIWVIPEVLAWKLRRPVAPAVIRDQGSLILISVLWWVGIVGGFLFPFFLPNLAIPYQHPAFYIGICFILGGVMLRWYSVSVLGKYFTFNIAIQSNQMLVEHGPYRYVRHPSYSGALVSLLGFGLALGNWASLIFSFSCLTLAYAYRIPVEESTLRSAFGEKYLQYQKKTRRLIPFVL